MVLNMSRILLATLFAGRALANGALSHLDITDRTIQGFKSQNGVNKSVLENHKSFLEAGSIFPDWGYLCGSPGGEEAHWPPFIQAYIKYLNKNY
jgi:glycosylphosphatidylinositol phospholipase D